MGKLFGTNGVRGFANQDMNAELALKLGRSLGSFLQKGDTVLVGRDTRTSGPMLVASLSAGLQSAGVHVHDAGEVTTPALQYAVKTGKGRYAAGAVVTASHNPPEFNGIKFIDPDGTEMRSDKEDAIEALFFADKFRSVPWSDIGQGHYQPGVNNAYVDAILGKVDHEAIRRAKLTVVLDTSNGAGSHTAPYLLRKLGVHVVTMNAQPDGTFPGHPSEPTPENVKDLVAATRAFGASLGVVQDGDADRCVFIDEKGAYVDGNRTLALMAGFVVSQKKGGLVVTPVSSSGIIEEHVKAKGGKVAYTKVGAPIVARYMMDHGAVVGGEENGGIIWPEFQHCRDASMTLAKVLELLASSGKSFSALLAELPTAASVKKKVECPNERKQKALDGFAKAHAKDRVDTTDGVKVYTSEGWVLVRPSGTEPIFRVYAESKTPEQAEALALKSLAEIREIIRTA
ncbi:MAG: phosphomannomutase / phosphoglucomutase [Thermoplasmata archaeon]|jgi:phosphomannomutase/phosphoglucomutase|nr:phosphomannomutase / phosphoglucomutase [Thermoplasmata archaeon]